MQTAAARMQNPATRFFIRCAALTLGLFGMIRLPWFEGHLMLPLARAQGVIAAGLFGMPTTPVEATLACSGSEALALCLGAIFAYPVSWRTRMVGAAGGVVLIVAINIVRIGTLGRVAASPTWFSAGHLGVWPIVLTLALAAYVVRWMRAADTAEPTVLPRVVDDPVAPKRPGVSGRFVVLATLFLLVFTGLAPLYLDSDAVLTVASFVARRAAAVLSAIGFASHAVSNVVWTPRGGFLVTQECISTPLIPVYLAGVCAYSTTWRGAAIGILGTLPLFVTLGVVRLLMVALPDAVGSPIFFVHAFYQLFIGVALIAGAAVWRHGRRLAFRPAAIGVGIGALALWLLGPVYEGLLALQPGVRPDDPQGALALLPPYQVALYLALWASAFVGAPWRRVAAGLTLLLLTQAGGSLLLHAIVTHSGLVAQVRDIRGWAIAVPVLILATVVAHAPARS